MKDVVINVGAIPTLSPGYRFQWEQAQDCFVLLYPEGMVKLNLPAGEILKRVTKKEQTVEELIAELKAAFDGADLDDDVYQFLEEAHDKCWISFK
jgi:pyrroloquinoline quinone biosynthesis protein D